MDRKAQHSLSLFCGMKRRQCYAIPEFLCKELKVESEINQIMRIMSLLFATQYTIPYNPTSNEIEILSNCDKLGFGTLIFHVSLSFRLAPTQRPNLRLYLQLILLKGTETTIFWVVY